MATFKEVLTRDAYTHVTKLNKKLVEGYNRELKSSGLEAYVVSAGANGALMFFDKPIQNYRDWLKADTELWRHYWFAMVNRGVMAQPYWWDEQWTISVAHTEQISTSTSPRLLKLLRRWRRRRKSHTCGGLRALSRPVGERRRGLGSPHSWAARARPTEISNH